MDNHCDASTVEVLHMTGAGVKTDEFAENRFLVCPVNDREESWFDENTPGCMVSYDRQTAEKTRRFFEEIFSRRFGVFAVRGHYSEYGEFELTEIDDQNLDQLS